RLPPCCIGEGGHRFLPVLLLALKWLAGANITTFACGEISCASRLAVPMTRGLSHGLPLFEARSPLGHSFGRCFGGDVVGTFRPRIMRYHILEKEPCCASQQNWPANVRFGSFSSDRRAPNARGLSASLRKRTCANSPRYVCLPPLGKDPLT